MTKKLDDGHDEQRRMPAMFFYGTLINEHILRRVIGRTSAASLLTQDAQLHGYCRLKLRHAHYPALVPVSVAQVALNRAPTLAEQTVTGKLVSGLTASEVTLLDAFEGEEYKSHTAFVNLMDPNSPPAEAVVYFYAPPIVSQNILPSLWSYDEFVHNHLAQWVADPNNF
ncbi:hypothetical protein VP01_1893g5 [Puccinia sorghi]|uniref:Putative gamma-glutamylcyclotransferase n=1 Tax=Puccinia sorghi TaxID=27349 RepID=A0A0L6VD30_9BASI|nr:hypothetical protein VP01_1893g5 [Puccinia sorghi]